MEARVAAEKERRANQQKARKMQRKHAHQKHVSRVVAKKYLIGLKENALSTLASMNMLTGKMERSMEEQVLPWLMEQREQFVEDRKDAVTVTDELIELGIKGAADRHAKTIKARADRIKNAAKELKQREIATQKRRKERQLAREKRAKDQAKAKLRDEVRRVLIDKAQIVSPAISQELVDIHGCYERSKTFLCALGGQI